MTTLGNAMATFHAVLHAAAKRSTRLNPANASRVTSTILAILGYVPASERVS
jgi:hypothetical protein